MKALLASFQQTTPHPRPAGESLPPASLLIFGMGCRTLGRAHGRWWLPEAPALERDLLLSGAQTSGSLRINTVTEPKGSNLVERHYHPRPVWPWLQLHAAWVILGRHRWVSSGARRREHRTSRPATLLSDLASQLL